MPDKQCRIGVTMRVVQAHGYHEPRDALAQGWSDFLVAALDNPLWIALPNLGANSIGDYCAAWGINRLILSGGENIGDAPLRDETENALLAWARKHKTPVLGICRGMQVMSSFMGSPLRPVDGHVRQRHHLSGEITHEVNSFHAYGLATCPDGFKVIARSKDGEIEAISNAELRWEGWMWHPEREALFAPADIDRLQKLFR
jgi:gamma-glutamyl-gamma-aminobutyrate hydrolase PuuD